MAWFLFLGITSLPFISLLLSLPTMLMTKVELSCPKRVPINSTVSVKLITKSPLPVPPVNWKFRAHESFSGKNLLFAANASFLADHCGSIQITLQKSRIYDYLGLISFPIRGKLQKNILVMPEILPVKDVPCLKKYLNSNWKPKIGGGFAENYDLREYRPGDDLKRIHWKLVAKTGKAILREPIVPVRGKIVLAMSLVGSPEILDRKFGRLSYLAYYLLDKNLPFEICCGAGEGIETYSIESRQNFTNALDMLLQLPLASEELESVSNSAWQYMIGGEENEE